MPTRTAARLDTMESGQTSGTSTPAQAASEPSSTGMILPVCDLSLPEFGRPRSFHWNAHGQACCLTESVVYILTPSIGYHPLLKPNQPSKVGSDGLLDLPTTGASENKQSTDNVATADFMGKPKPLDFFGSGIDLASAQVVTASTHDRAISSQDYDAVNLGTLGTIFREAHWSPPGLGPANSCLLAVVTTNWDVKIIAAEKNPVLGPWTVSEAVNCSDGLKQKKTRFSALADQAVSAAWSPLIPTSPAKRRSALFAAGTRSGEVIVWQRNEAKAGFSGPKRIQLSTGPIASMAFSDNISEQDDGNEVVLKIAAATTNGPRIVEVIVRSEANSDEKSVELRVAQSQPPRLADRPCLSWMKFDAQDQLLITSPGRIRSWQVPSDAMDEDRNHASSSKSVLAQDLPGQGTWHSCSFSIAESAQDDQDPFATVVSASMHEGQASELCITLASRLQYRVPLTLPLPASVLPESTVSTRRTLALSSSTGLTPDRSETEYLLLNLEQQVENHQTVLGWATDRPTTASPASNGARLELAGVLQTNGDISAFKVRLDQETKFSLILKLTGLYPRAENDSLTYRDLLQAGLKHSFQLKSKDETPIQRYRNILALYYASSPALKRQLLQELCIQLSGPEANDAGSKPSEQDQYWLTSWLRRECSTFASSSLNDVSKGSLDDSHNLLRTSLTARWVLEELRDNTAILGHETELSSESKMYLKRLVAVSCQLKQWLSKNNHSKLLTPLMDELVSASDTFRAAVTRLFDLASGAEGQPLDFGEKCPACNADVMFVGSESTEQFKQPEWVQCPSGHVFKRCSVTFGILATSNVRTCEGCRNKSASTTDQATTEQSGSSVDLIALALDRAKEKCMLCGCRWLSLV
ncbi:unnamed protein product [Sympodiomycopsis kandeliae]